MEAKACWLILVKFSLNLNKKQGIHKFSPTILTIISKML